jgi:hypothetical protein
VKSILFAGAAVLALSTAPAFALDCTPTANEIDPRCYGAAGDGVTDDGVSLQNAINAAIQADKPLYLPHLHFLTHRPLVIDYGQGSTQGHEGFIINSDGATIDGTQPQIAGNLLTIACGGGTSQNPKGCFYFHQMGTLFVNANTPYWALVVGEGDFSDAQNSIVFDHIVVNNSGSGGGTILDYVLSSKFNLVSDTAGGQPGLAMMQVQMSTLQIAATSYQSSALAVWNYYNFGDTIQSPDFENSPICVLALGVPAHDVTINGGQFNCATAFDDPGHVISASGYNVGGAVKVGFEP